MNQRTATTPNLVSLEGAAPFMSVIGRQMLGLSDDSSLAPVRRNKGPPLPDWQVMA